MSVVLKRPLTEQRQDLNVLTDKWKGCIISN